MLLFMECVIFCLLFTFIILPAQYKDPINMIMSYPPKIRERVEALPHLTICLCMPITFKQTPHPYASIFRQTTCFTVRKSCLKNFCYARLGSASLSTVKPRNKGKNSRGQTFSVKSQLQEKYWCRGGVAFEVFRMPRRQPHKAKFEKQYFNRTHQIESTYIRMSS